MGGGGGGGSYCIRWQQHFSWHVDMNACDHFKQGLETQIASETHNDPDQKLQMDVNLPRMYQMT